MLNDGHDVVITGRSRVVPLHFFQNVDYRKAELSVNEDWRAITQDVNAVVHCAFAHQQGRYRGGEGDDPVGFRSANVDASLALANTARQSGVERFIFLSSRAVYDGFPPGSILAEDLHVAPTTLYGEVKRDVETGLAALDDDHFKTFCLRATGIYGPGSHRQTHKWTSLFESYRLGKPISPRVATELHAADLADAASRLLAIPSSSALSAPMIMNASDIVLDRHDLLNAYSAATGIAQPLPPRADSAGLNIMTCSRLRAIGWAPRGHLDLNGMI